MLKRIDRYIIFKYLKTFFFTVLLITLVAIVIDFSERADKVLDDDIPFKEVIFDYYLNFIPWINGLLWPLFSLIAVIFFTSRMAKNTEIVAMLSAGVSYNRILVPYLISAVIIAGTLWVGSNYIIPNSTKIKNDFETKYISKSKVKTRGTNIHLFLGPEEKVFLRYFRKVDTTGQSFRYEKFDGRELSYVLKANRISLKEFPNTWTLTDYEKRSFIDGREELIIAKGEKMDTTMNLTPNDFIINAKDMITMTTPQLRKVVERNKTKGLDTANKYLIEIHKRSSDPFTVIILTLIGAAVATRKSRGGMGLHLAIGVVVGSVFVLLSRFSETFSYNLNLPAMIGVWIPNILFLAVAIYLISKAQK